MNATLNHFRTAYLYKGVTLRDPYFDMALIENSTQAKTVEVRGQHFKFVIPGQPEWVALRQKGSTHCRNAFQILKSEDIYSPEIACGAAGIELDNWQEVVTYKSPRAWHIGGVVRFSPIPWCPSGPPTYHRLPAELIGKPLSEYPGIEVIRQPITLSLEEVPIQKD